MDMNGEYLPRGVLGVGGSPLPAENGQQIVDQGSFAAMEKSPAQLMILLRSWEDEVQNCYFPVTLR